MCMFTGEVKSVSKTKIAVIACQTSGEILTTYTNTVSSDNDNNMVLPVAIDNYKQIRLVDMSKEDQLFDYLDTIFNPPRRSSGARGIMLSMKSDSHEKLEVFEVGSFKISIVPSFDDFCKLDESQVGEVSPKMVELLEKTYQGEQKFSFLVCKFKGGDHQFHPIGWTVPIRSWAFVPTMHFHGEIEASADWDHDIYFVGFGPSKDIKTLASFPKYAWMDFAYKFKDSTIGTITEDKKNSFTISVHGSKINCDIVVPLLA